MPPYRTAGARAPPVSATGRPWRAWRRASDRRPGTRTGARGRRRWPAAPPTDGRWRRTGRPSAPSTTVPRDCVSRNDAPSSAFAAVAPRHTSTAGATSAISASSHGLHAAHLAPPRRLVDAARAARLPLEVLDGVGQEDLAAIQSGGGSSPAPARRRPDRQTAHRPGPPGRRAARRRASPGASTGPGPAPPAWPSCRGRSACTPARRRRGRRAMPVSPWTPRPRRAAPAGPSAGLGRTAGAPCGRAIASGLTQRSKSAAATWPEPSAASRSGIRSRCAAVAISAARE